MKDILFGAGIVGIVLAAAALYGGFAWWIWRRFDV